MKAFPALIIAMRLVNQEVIRDYWSTDEVLSSPFFSLIMPRDKFMNILSYFHFCDNYSTVTVMFLGDKQGPSQQAW